MKSIICLALLVSLLSHAIAADWPVFKRDTARTGYAREQAYPSLTTSWVYDAIQGEVRSSPVVSEGKVFIGAGEGSIWAYDAETGSVAWQYSSDGPVDATPAVWNGYVFVPSSDGRLYAFSTANGQSPAWVYTSGSRDVSSPVVYDKKIFWTTGYPNKQLLAVNANTGNLMWQRDIGSNSHSSPAIENGAVAVGANSGLIAAFSAADGTPLWTYATAGRVEFSSLAGDGAGYFYAVTGGDDPNLYAWNALTGQLKSGFPVVLADLTPQPFGQPGSEVSSVAIANGKIYVTMTGVTAPDTIELQIFCRNVSDGSQAWPPVVIGTPPEGLGYASTPAIANDVLYVGSGDGNLYMLDAVTGASIGAVNLGGAIISSPAVANGKVFVGTMAGAVYGLSCARVAAIASPADNSVVGGTVNVTGVVDNPDFQSYQVEYGVGAAPSAWTAIGAPQTAPQASIGTIANWDTSLLPSSTYTLRLTVTDSGPAALLKTAYVTLQVNATFSSIFVSRVTGATLTSSDGTTLVIPAGGLNQNDSVTIQAVATLPGSDPTGTTGTAIARQITFDDAATQFTLPATLTIPYTDIAVAGLSLDKLKLFFWNGTGWVLVSNSTVDISQKNVTALITQPGLYRIFEHRYADPSQEFIYISPDGAEVYVPAGAFSQGDTVTITRITSGNVIDANTPRGTTPLPDGWEFLTGRSDTTFLKPVTIKIPYAAAPGSTSASHLRIYLWYPSENLWRIVNNSTADDTIKKISVKVSHFSIYRGMGFATNGPLLEKDKVYVYPNPAKGDTITFKTYLGDDAAVTFEIFNVAGEKVGHLTNEGTAGNVIETPWDIGRMASGVYVFRVEAKSTSGAKASVTKKLAIIH